MFELIDIGKQPGTMPGNQMQHRPKKHRPVAHEKLKQAPGTWIERTLWESPAYNALRGYAPQLLTHILGKRQFENIRVGKKQKRICKNCDSLNVTYVEFKKKGITQPRMTRALDQLLEKGFLTVVHQGGAFQQDKAVYALSENWQFWRPGTVFETRKKETVKRGCCEPKK